MTRPIHYAVTNDFGLYADTNSACGNNFNRSKKLTDDPDQVTCRACRDLCGFEALTNMVERELRATIEMQNRTGAMPSAPALVLRTAPLRVAAVPASIRIAGDI